MNQRRPSEPTEISKLLDDFRDRPQELREQLYPLVYEEMRKIARRQMMSEKSVVTLQPTVLVHEAYIRLANEDPRWKNKDHFLAVAALVMRQVAVEYARRRDTIKRGGDVVREIADESIPDEEHSPEDSLAVGMALDKLEKLDPLRAQVVDLTYFGGLTIEEAAEAMGLKLTKTKGILRLARAWLTRELMRTKRQSDN